MTFLLFILFLVLSLIGIPIAYALGVSSLAYIVYNNVTLVLVAQKIFTGMDSFLLTAIPLFILAGNLMNASKLTEELIDFCKIIVGRIKGGLAYVNVLISMVFAGMTGAGVSDTAAVGTIMIPGMEKDGYEKGFSAAVTIISSTIGPIIPPSIPFIVYGSMTGISIGALFLAGLIPGLLLGLSQMVVIFGYSKRVEFPRIKEKKSPQEMVKVTKDATLALLMPVIILGGIVGGFATPTESAGIAAFYAFFVGVFIRKTVTLRVFFSVLVSSGVTTGAIMILMGTANLFSYILTAELFPQTIAELVLGVTQNKIVVLALVNVVLLVFGMFLDVVPALLVLTPVFLPLVENVGVHPLHYGVICVLNLVIGLATPPVGMCLFVGANIARLTIEKVSRKLLPFLVAVFIVLAIVTYWEWLILLVPRLFDLI